MKFHKEFSQPEFESSLFLRFLFRCSLFTRAFLSLSEVENLYSFSLPLRSTLILSVYSLPASFSFFSLSTAFFWLSWAPCSHLLNRFLLLRLPSSLSSFFFQCCHRLFLPRKNTWSALVCMSKHGPWEDQSRTTSKEGLPRKSKPSGSCEKSEVHSGNQAQFFQFFRLTLLNPIGQIEFERLKESLRRFLFRFHFPLRILRLFDQPRLVLAKRTKPPHPAWNRTIKPLSFELKFLLQFRWISLTVIHWNHIQRRSHYG